MHDCSTDIFLNDANAENSMGELLEKGLTRRNAPVDWTLSDSVLDRMRAYNAYHTLQPVTLEGLFERAVWTVLSPQEYYEKQSLTTAKIIHYGLMSPEAILENRDKLKLRRALGGVQGPNQKRERIVQLAEWWYQSGIPKTVEHVSKMNWPAWTPNGSKRQVFAKSLRDLIADETPGMSLKCASMWLGHTGVPYFPPIDIWMVRFLNDTYKMGFREADYVTTGQLPSKEYAVAENLLAKFARKKHLTPYDCQVALWVAATGWQKQDFIDVRKVAEQMNAQQQFYSHDEIELMKPKKSREPETVRKKQVKQKAVVDVRQKPLFRH